MSQRSTKRSSRAAAPRRLTRWSTYAGAAVAGLLLGSLLFEPMVARLAPQQFVLDTASVVGAHRVAAEELVSASGVAAGTSVLALDPAAVSDHVSRIDRRSAVVSANDSPVDPHTYTDPIPLERRCSA